MKVVIRLVLSFIYLSVLTTCSGTSGSEVSIIVENYNCDGFIPLDKDIAHDYPQGITVYSNNQSIGCLSFVRETSVDVYSYGIINKQGYLFYLNQLGQFSSLGENVHHRGFVQIEGNNNDDNGEGKKYIGLLVKVVYSNTTDDQILNSYMPLALNEVKDKQYPNEGDLGFFYAYQIQEQAEPTYGCLDISAETQTPLIKNTRVAVLGDNREIKQDKSPFEIWNEDVIDYYYMPVYFEGKILDKDTCIQDAFKNKTIPDYTGELVFKSFDGNPIFLAAINFFAKTSIEYCVESDIC